MHRDQMAIHPCLRLPLTHHSTSLLHRAHTEIYTRSGTLPPPHMPYEPDVQLGGAGLAADRGTPRSLPNARRGQYGDGDGDGDGGH